MTILLVPSATVLFGRCIQAYQIERKAPDGTSTAAFTTGNWWEIMDGNDAIYRWFQTFFIHLPGEMIQFDYLTHMFLNGIETTN